MFLVKWAKCLWEERTTLIALLPIWCFNQVLHVQEWGICKGLCRCTIDVKDRWGWVWNYHRGKSWTHSNCENGIHLLFCRSFDFSDESFKRQEHYIEVRTICKDIIKLIDIVHFVEMSRLNREVEYTYLLTCKNKLIEKY